MRSLSELFEILPEPKGYSNELAAVADGRKCMSMFTGHSNSEYIDFVRKTAAEMGLIITSFQEEEILDGNPTVTTRLYVCQKDNLWRVDLHRSFINIMMRNLPWSFGAEEYESYLLGYTDEMIREWMRYKRASQTSAGCCAAYLISPRLTLKMPNSTDSAA